MENTVRIRTELDIQAEKIISCFMDHNENIKAQVEAGVKRAFENFDIEKEIEEAVTKNIHAAIHDSRNYGKIMTAVYAKVDQIIAKKVDEIMNTIEIK